MSTVLSGARAAPCAARAGRRTVRQSRRRRGRSARQPALRASRPSRPSARSGGGSPRPCPCPCRRRRAREESAVMCAAVGNGWWKVMSRSPSTTITRLRFISPGPAPHAATEAKVGTTFSGRGVGVASLTKASSFSSIGSAPMPDAIGVEHHFAIGVGVFLAEIFQRHQLFVLDRHVVCFLSDVFCAGCQSQRPLPLWERASPSAVRQTRLGEGLAPQRNSLRAEDTPHPALRATFSHKGRRRRTTPA